MAKRVVQAYSGKVRGLLSEVRGEVAAMKREQKKRTTVPAALLAGMLEEDARALHELAAHRQLTGGVVELARALLLRELVAVRNQEARRVVRPRLMDETMSDKYAARILAALDVADVRWVAVDYASQSVEPYATHPGNRHRCVVLDARDTEEWRTTDGERTVASVRARLLGYARPAV